MPLPRIVAKVGWVLKVVQAPTAVPTSYCYVTPAGFRKAALGQRAVRGPTARLVPGSEENTPTASKSDSAAVRCGCAARRRQRWAAARHSKTRAAPLSERWQAGWRRVFFLIWGN